MNKEPEIIPTLVSIIPNLVGGEGHIIPYHIAVNEATKILGWHHKIAYSGDSKIENLPKEWVDCLKGENLESETNFIGKIVKLTNVIIFAKTIRNYLKLEILNTSETTIIFMERFIHLQLLALCLAILFIPKKKLHIWLLYRMDTHTNKTRFIYKLINKLIKKLVSPANFRLLTDSELLSNSLSKYFNETVTVMPIPHTECIINKQEHKNNYIVAWWAGPPREEKGWQIINNMLEYQAHQFKRFCLVAAKSSQLQSVKDGIKINLIDDNLSRQEYVKWLTQSDLILLPYNVQSYQERTSGIFTEAIIAGKITVVTPNTWMAKELAKYNLENLIIDWGNNETIFNNFAEILNNNEILGKIKIMQKEYQNFHNVSNYAVIMKNLFFKN